MQNSISRVKFPAEHVPGMNLITSVGSKECHKSQASCPRPRLGHQFACAFDHSLLLPPAVGDLLYFRILKLLIMDIYNRIGILKRLIEESRNRLSHLIPREKLHNGLHYQRKII